MLAYIIWDCNPVIVNIGSFALRYYSLSWLIGFALGYLAVKKIFIKENLDLKQLQSLLAYVFVGALIGARLGHCLFYDWGYFRHHLLEIILPVAFTPGVRFVGYAGLASHGGAIGVAVSLILFNMKYKIPFLSLLDKLAFASPLAGAFIRIGNFFNSEIIGAPTSVSWGVVFKQIGDNVPRHPAQLYEAVAYLVAFAVLCFAYRQKYKAGFADGMIFGISMTLIFAARFVIEYCKEVQEPFEIGLRQSVGMDMGQ